MTHRWIATQDEFEAVVDTLSGVERYAIDTEFHRERTYFPKLALVQLGWDDQIVLVDPIAVDVTPLRRLFASPAVAVFHAAQQDLDVLTHSVGSVPARMFDTQLAAGFTGYSTPSLQSLLHAELGVNASKGDRLTDWLRRPLTADQQVYAAGDVAHLLELHDRLTAQLTALGRLTWASDACEELRTRPTGAIDPEQAWLRLKDVRVLKARSRGVAQAVAAWRERRAASVDVPVRQILPDLAILGIAQKHPSTPAELAHARGVEERHSRGAIGAEILAAVQAGLARDVSVPVPEGDELDRSLRPAVTLVSAWVSEVARAERIDTALLATRADLVALLRGDREARLASGWRAELLGDGVRSLVEGRAGLTFDGRGGLRLIPVAPAIAV
ncbi:MAG: ribonuclease D [Acidimicrobiales bacterium]|nr:ribonuclease D [Acidimicrobiales bacterium]MCB9395464.1 ribonuclease D [Acidimicrobiaceae bacterium]